MSQVILYKQDNGKVAVVMPTPEALSALGIDAIAKKDVPEGKAYKITDHVYLPTTPQEQWVFDDSFFDSGVGE